MRATSFGVELVKVIDGDHGYVFRREDISSVRTCDDGSTVVCGSKAYYLDIPLDELVEKIWGVYPDGFSE